MVGLRGPRRVLHPSPRRLQAQVRPARRRVLFFVYGDDLHVLVQECCTCTECAAYQMAYFMKYDAPNKQDLECCCYKAICLPMCSPSED